MSLFCVAAWAVDGMKAAAHATAPVKVVATIIVFLAVDSTMPPLL
jgi:hypothetical protein